MRNRVIKGKVLTYSQTRGTRGVPCWCRMRQGFSEVEKRPEALDSVFFQATEEDGLFNDDTAVWPLGNNSAKIKLDPTAHHAQK